jgi:hypothetical protein
MGQEFPSPVRRKHSARTILVFMRKSNDTVAQSSFERAQLDSNAGMVRCSAARHRPAGDHKRP